MTLPILSAVHYLSTKMQMTGFCVLDHQMQMYGEQSTYSVHLKCVWPQKFHCINYYFKQEWERERAANRIAAHKWRHRREQNTLNIRIKKTTKHRIADFINHTSIVFEYLGTKDNNCVDFRLTKHFPAWCWPVGLSPHLCIAYAAPWSIDEFNKQLRACVCQCRTI